MSRIVTQDGVQTVYGVLGTQLFTLRLGMESKTQAFQVESCQVPLTIQIQANKQTSTAHREMQSPSCLHCWDADPAA